jgi:hypothetical protein
MVESMTAVNHETLERRAASADSILQLAEPATKTALFDEYPEEDQARHI